MITVRDATFDDFEACLALAHKVHDFFPAHLRDHPLNEAQIQRTFVFSIYASKGFVKVAEKDGKIIGCLVAAIAQNGWGLQVASDIFMFAEGATKKLLQAYREWANEKGADIVHVIDLCGRPGYHEVIEAAGFKRAGTLFFGEQ